MAAPVRGVPHQGRGAHRQLVVAGVDPVAVLALHADVGGAGVVPLEHRALGALDAWNIQGERLRLGRGWCLRWLTVHVIRLVIYMLKIVFVKLRCPVNLAN